MKNNLSLINVFRLFVIICLLFSAAALPANSPKIVQAQPSFSEETPAVTPDVTEEVTPTPEVTEEVTETPTPEVTEDVTETPTQEVTEDVTETPTPEVTEDVTETPTPEVTEEVTETPELTEEPVQEELESQNAAICATVTEIPQSECEALVALYQSTNGTNWKNRTGWLISETPCSWHGVVCESGRVTEIQLSSNKLTGTLPTQIGNFPQLKVLSVQTNAIGGVIPSEIGNLSKLITLLLSFNSFEGSIPTTIGQLTVLDRVELSRNKLTGAIPDEIGGMTSLLHIWGYDNQLTGPIPSTLNNLTKLTTFHFSGNQLSGAIPDLSAISNLTGLYLANNQLTGSVPSSVSKKVSLVTINLSNNMLTGTLSSDFGTLTNLEVLNLSGNQLTGTIPTSFGGMTKLWYLNLGSNLLEGTIPSQLGSLSNLKELYLNNNELSGASWPEWLNNLTQLERLNLSNNFELGGIIPPEIGNLVNLRLLDISHNHFWGEIPLAITNLTKLNIKVKSSDARAYTDIGHNHLTSKITKVRDFLLRKDPDWAKTQTPANPIPLIQSLNPPRAKAGSDEIVLEVRGKSMMDGAVVFVDGVEYPTTFVNTWTLQIVIPASELTTEKAIEITAKNPWPTVQESAVYNFYVSNLEPAVGSTVLSRRPNFWWYEVPGADLYQFQISPYKSFGSAVTKLTSPTNDLTLTKDLPINRMIFWRVRGRVGGVFGDWSPTYSFRSAKPPSNPILSSPANNSLTTNYTPKLSWRIVSLPSGTVFEKYQLQVASDLSFASGTIVLDESITTRGKPFYTLSLGVLNPNWKYYWRVRAFNTLAHESNWSTPRAIRSAMLPPAAPLPEPVDLTPRPELTWEPVDGAVSYIIHLSTYSNFSSLLQTGKSSTNTFTLKKNLPQNKIIHWRVRAIGPNGPSLWTKSSFRSANPPYTPLLSAPANNVLTTSYTPVLKWRVSSLPKGTTFQHYILQISKSKDFSTDVTIYPPITNRLQTSLQVGPLESNTLYYWRMQAWNTAGHYSTWSAVRSFRTAMLPVAVLDDPAGLTLRPTFTWSAVDPESGPPPTSYTIQFSRYASFGSLISSSKALTNTFTPTRDLPKNATIYWRVRANGVNGPTLWKDSSFLSVNPPSKPSLVSPANGAYLKTLPKLDWSNSNVPAGTTFSHYEVQVASDSAFGSLVVENNTTDSEWNDWGSVAPLSSKARYYWQVRAVNSVGEQSSWSSRYYFTAP